MKLPLSLMGKHVWIIGGGPSLADVDLAPLAGRSVIAVNESYRLFPDAHALVFTDLSWWRKRREDVLAQFGGHKISRGHDPPTMRRDGVIDLEFVSGEFWSWNPKRLGGRNAGLVAINAAHHMGAAAVILLGFDMHPTGGRNNWHNHHEHSEHNCAARYRDLFLPEFEQAAAQIERSSMLVVNATDPTALRCFPMRSYGWCLERFKEARL